MRGERVPTEVELRDAPVHTPSAAEYADLALLLAGAYEPLRGFLGRGDLRSVATTGRLADGTTWPVPVTLRVPAGLLAPDADTLVLADAEGAPVAGMAVTERWPGRDGIEHLAGEVTRYGDGGRAPFARLRLSTSAVKTALTTPRVVGVFADRPLHRPQLAQLTSAARQLAAQVVVLVPVDRPGPDGLAPEALVRCILAARDRLPQPIVVAVPMPDHHDELADGLLRSKIAASYGVTHLLSISDTAASGGTPRVLVPRALAYDNSAGQWHDRNDVPARFARAPLTRAELAELLDDGILLPEWHTPPAVAKELARARPARRNRGLVLFFTGLSGSGKSTVAQAVADALLETGERTLTLLDGDVVRRELSKGLTFSKEDRDLNIRRIGWVAAETARHGGLAICCPIAPYAAARSIARAMATVAGAGFVLVHVATPIEVCEARDRKGLYAKARAGLLTGMTGVDDPYEIPTDAEVTLNTAEGSVDDAVKAVLSYLEDEGWISARSS